jgi:DNA-binding XRE family transcriptional regulator
MTTMLPATVLFGDVVDSRRDPGASAFLRSLREELDASTARERLAPAGFTQGDEIQLLLVPGADAFRIMLRAALRPDARGMRWAAAAGLVEPGSGPATERTGAAFRSARSLLERAKTHRLGLAATTGDPAADDLLAELGPLLPALLGELTVRQREVGRLLVVDGLRQAEAAERLAVSRATISVIAERGRIRHLQGLAAGLATIFRDGVARADAIIGDVPDESALGVGSAT